MPAKKTAPANSDAATIAPHNAKMVAKAAAAQLAKQAAKADTKTAKAKPVLTIDPTEAPVPEAAVATPSAVTTEATPTAKAKGKKAKDAAPEAPSKLSALDAAAKVLAETGTPLNTKAMVEAMAAKQYWSSPNGKTPAATLYSAILREVSVKGKESRFRKAAKGLFEATGK